MTEPTQRTEADALNELRVKAVRQLDAATLRIAGLEAEKDKWYAEACLKSTDYEQEHARANALESKLNICRVALGIQPDEKIPDQEPKHGSILVDHGGQRKRISPTNDENIKLERDIVELEKQNERLLSLVRLQRAELHEQNAITDKEYADLVQQSNLRVLLETHDDLREQLKTQADEIGRLKENVVQSMPESLRQFGYMRLWLGATITQIHRVAQKAREEHSVKGHQCPLRSAIDSICDRAVDDYAMLKEIGDRYSTGTLAEIDEIQDSLQSLLADIGGFDANLLNTPMESKGEFATRELAAIWAKHGHLYKEPKTPYATCGTCGVEVFPGVRHDCKPVAVQTEDKPATVPLAVAEGQWQPRWMPLPPATFQASTKE